jgi:hypothetical protein
MKNEMTEKNKNITLLANRRFLIRTYDPNDICNNHIHKPSNSSINNTNFNPQSIPGQNNNQQNYNRTISYNFNKISNQIEY